MLPSINLPFLCVSLLLPSLFSISTFLTLTSSSLNFYLLYRLPCLEQRFYREDQHLPDIKYSSSVI